MTDRADAKKYRDPNYLHTDHLAEYRDAPTEAPPPPVQNLRVLVGTLFGWAQRCRDFRELRLTYDEINASPLNERPLEFIDDEENQQIIVRWAE